MNAYVFSLLLFSYGTFFTSLLVAFKRQDELGRAFVLFSFFVCAWGILFSFMLNNAVSYEKALLCARLSDVFAIFIGPSWLSLISLYLNINNKNIKLIKTVYFFSGIIALFGATKYFIPSLKPIMVFSHWLEPGPAFHLFTVQFFVVVFVGFSQLIYAWQESESFQRKQIGIFIVATFFGFSGGSFTFLANYGIDFPQYGIFIMPLYPFIMAYAMIRHGLLDAEQVLALQREKLVFLGMMSSSINHEIKNPLFIMQELGRKAESGLQAGSANGEVLTSVQKINGQLVRVKKMIDRITEFGRPEVVPGQIEDVYLDKVIDNCLFFASQEFKHLPVETKVQIDDSVKVIRGNRNQYEQIFLNLIMNAFYAMPNGGTLKIEGRVIAKQTPLSPSPLIGEGRLGMVEITISDTGIGIPKSELKNIFKPFYTTKEKTGTGLGLHIVKTLVEQNSGKISVESELRRGTCFTIKLPTAQGVSVESL